MRIAVPSLLLLLAATAPALPNGARLEQRQRAQAEAGDEIIVYRTKPGESLQDIAGQWFTRPEDWRRAQALNKIKDPANIPAGTAIRLRNTWLKTTPITAELAAFRGNVQVVRGTESRPVMKGMELSEGDIVETGPNGFATLVLPDASQVSLPSSSRIRLARLRQVPMSDSIDRRFTLEQGRSEAKVTPMANPASRFLITTPVSVAAVRGTQFRVTYTPGELKAVTEVTEGKVAVGRFQSIEEVLVRANFGAIATSTGLSRAFDLLEAPAVETPERLQDEKAVTFRLKPVQGANKYLVEIATDAAFVDRVGSTEIPDTVAVFEGVANGNYYVRAFAVDAKGLVGRPAQYSFQRNFADPQEAGGGKREEKKPDVATLGDRDPQEFAWFENDSGTVNLVDSGALGGGGGGFAGNGDDVGPVVPIEEAGVVLNDPDDFSGGGNDYWPIGGGGNGGGYSGGGGHLGGGGGGGGGYQSHPDGGNGNSGGGNGGNNGGGNPDTSNPDTSNPDTGNPGGGNPDTGNPGGENPGNGNPGGGGNGNPGGGNGGDTGNGGNGGNGNGGNGGGDTGNPGNPGNGGGDGGGDTGGNNGGGGDTGGGNTGGGNTGGGDSGNGGNGNPGGGNGNGGGDGNPGGGVVVIPVDPTPTTPIPPVDGGGGGQPTPNPGNGGVNPGEQAPIPEPAAWALMIAGFGLVGAMLRRRRALPA